MKAVVLHEHGQMDKLIYQEDFPDPECGPEDVIVGVKATSLNYHDLFTRNGMPGITLNLPIICGLDVAGEIIELGAKVKDWAVGDKVLIDPRNRVEGGLVGRPFMAAWPNIAARARTSWSRSPKALPSNRPPAFPSLTARRTG